MKMQTILNRNTIFFVLVILAMLGMILFSNATESGFDLIDTQGISFAPGRVIEVVTSDTSIDQFGLHRGRQDLKVELLSGEYKGLVIDVRNTLSVDHSIYVYEGDRIIVYLDGQPGTEYYFATVQSYERTGTLVAISALFLCLLTVVGRKTGLRSIFGLVFTFVVILFLLVPLIVRGAPPTVSAVGLVLCIIAVSLISTLGFSKKTLVSIIGTGTGALLCCIIYLVTSGVFRIGGMNVPEVDTLTVISYNTGIRIGEFLFVGILISSLGAVMDVSVSMASSLAELSEQNHTLGFMDIFRSGMNIGRDIIGATMNTLIMAFTGTFFISLVVFRYYQFSALQLFNTDDIVIELIQAFVSTSALILCAPATAFAAAHIYTRKKNSSIS